MHPSSPCVSVIIPAYQAEAVLERAMDSVLAQDFPDFEVILVDDASTDRTWELIQKAEKRDARVRGLHLAMNRGPAGARNAGVGITSGRMLAFLDADDEWCPDVLANKVKILEAHPEVDLLFTDARNIYLEKNEFERLFGINNLFFRELKFQSLQDFPNTYLVEGPLRRSIYTKCFILPSTVLLRRSSFEIAKGFDPVRRGTEDIDLWVRLSAQSRFVLWNEETVVRHIRAGSVSSWNERWLRELVNYHRACLVSSDYIDLRGIARENLLKIYRYLIVFHALHSSPLKALNVWRESLDLGSQPKLAFYALASLAGPLPFRFWRWFSGLHQKQGRPSGNQVLVEF